MQTFVKTVSAERAETVQKSNSANNPTAAPIDLTYLTTKTKGNRSLEAELLALFQRQSQKITHDLTADETNTIAVSLPGYRARLAETLKGSAGAVGAWRIKNAAEQLVNVAVEPCDKTKLSAALNELNAAVTEANQLISELLVA